MYLNLNTKCSLIVQQFQNNANVSSEVKHGKSLFSCATPSVYKVYKVYKTL